ncbi:hypothetical protein SALBM135S_03456 [Streptomyces alboniger]
MGQAVGEVGDDVRQIVRDPAGDRGLAGLVRIEDLGVDVDRVQERREALAEVVDVLLGAEIRFVPLVGDDVLVRAEAAAGQEELGDLQEEEGDRRVRLVALGDLFTETMKLSTWSEICTAKSSGLSVTVFSVASDI